MFQKDDYLRYGAKGIFQVDDIVKRRDKNNKKTSWYVLLSHSNGVRTKILTPVENDELCNILSKDEAHQLIDEVPTLETIWNDNKHQREDTFKKILSSGKTRDLVQMIKSIHLAREEKLKEKKDISERDKEFFKNAENILFEEISISCGIEKDNVMNFINSKLSSVQ